MTRQETIVSPFPPGSGRKRDYTWPDWNINMTGVVSNLERDRPGATNATSGSIGGGVGSSTNLGVVNGVSCVRLINGVNLNNGPVCVMDQGARLHVTTSRANMKFSSFTDDFLCWRIYCIMRCAATPADATDFGFQVICGPNASNGVLHSAVPGWSLQLDNTGGTSLVQHGKSGAQTSTLLKSAAGGFVNTDFHCFEYRFLGATPNSDALFKVLLDGQLQLTRSFASVADDLPLPTSAGGNANNGYVVNVQAMSRNCELDVALIRSIAAPTEAALF